MSKERLTFEKAEMIRDLRRRGVPVAQICRDFRTSPTTVYDIQNGSRFHTPPEERQVAVASIESAFHTPAGEMEAAREKINRGAFRILTDGEFQRLSSAEQVAYATRRMKEGG